MATTGLKMQRTETIIARQPKALEDIPLTASKETGVSVPHPEELKSARKSNQLISGLYPTLLTAA